ncbi:putative glycosidase CRH2 [Mycoemilia scoparia]|uniref:Glycosidase CRH2 n=1 Tax=Mycoemilia scoparia TaxID=417184 RepID=A0A9W8DVS4_9FUNG|nr:putative glycosidase CRH2 [Mycoemilia scoparia]
MKLLSIFSITAALVATTAHAGGKCGKNVCDKFSPCCNGQYCNTGALYCMGGLCDPENSFKPDSCWNVAHCVDQKLKFSDSNAFADIDDYKGDPSKTAFVSQWKPNNAKIENGELVISLKKTNDKSLGATVLNTRRIQYGVISTVMKSGSTGPGAVSSVIVRNDNVGDEIDFEFVGKDVTTVQSNYYWHNELDYTKMVPSQKLSDTTQNYHTYTIDWDPNRIIWSVDGQEFRTVKRSDTWSEKDRTFKYPDTEATISFSMWDAGVGGQQGTIDWAGGLVDWSKGPYNMNVKSIDISCYFKGNETTFKPPKQDDDDKDDDDKKSDKDKDDKDDKDENSDSDDKDDKDDASESDDNDKESKSSESKGSSKSGSDEDQSSSDEDNTGAASPASMPLALSAVGSILMSIAAVSYI